MKINVTCRRNICEVLSYALNIQLRKAMEGRGVYMSNQSSSLMCICCDDRTCTKNDASCPTSKVDATNVYKPAGTNTASDTAKPCRYAPVSIIGS